MNDTAINKEEVHLLNFLVIFAKHSRIIIFSSIAVTVMVYLVLFMRPNKYTAIARLLPPQQNLTLSGQLLEILGGSVLPGHPGMGGGMGGMAASLLGVRSPGDLYVSVLNGNTICDRIIDRFNLKKVYHTKFIEDGRKALSANVKITAGKKDGIIVIEATAKTPKFAAEMANAFIEELEKLLQGLAMQEAKGRLAFLEMERLQTSQNLGKAEEALRHFSEQNSVLQIDTQTKGALEYIARLRAEIDSKEVGIQVLRQQATPFNYDVVRLETELQGLKEKLRTAESQYDNCLSDVCLPANKTPGLAMEYLRLYREVKFQDGLYQLYIKLAEIARMDMARENAVIQVIDPAKPPEKRSNRRLLPSLIAGMAAFFMVIFVSLGKESLKNKINREDDVQVQLLSDLRHNLEPWENQLKRIINVILFRRKS